MKKVVWHFAISGLLIPVTMVLHAQQSFTGDRNILNKRYGMYAAALKQNTLAMQDAQQLPLPGMPPGSSAENSRAIRPGIIIEPGLPLGKLKDAAGFVISINAEAKYFLTERLAAMVSVGFTNYFGKNHTFTEYNGNGDPQTFSVKTENLHAIPLQAGFHIGLTDNVFIQGTAGVSFLSNGGGTAFIYSPGIGYKLRQFEGRLKYEALSKNGTLSFIGLQLGYYLW